MARRGAATAGAGRIADGHHGRARRVRALHVRPPAPGPDARQHRRRSGGGVRERAGPAGQRAVGTALRAGARERRPARDGGCRREHRARHGEHARTRHRRPPLRRARGPGDQPASVAACVRQQRRAQAGRGRGSGGAHPPRHDARAATPAIPPADGGRDRRGGAARRRRDHRVAGAHAAAGGADAPSHARRPRGGRRAPRRLRARQVGGRARHAHAHVQPHDAEARRIAGGGGHLPAHARGQGDAAHARTGDRHRARVQAGPARHPDRPAEPVAAQPALEADPRAGDARRHAGRLPLPRLRRLQAHQRHARATTPATSCCRRSRSG